MRHGDDDRVAGLGVACHFIADPRKRVYLHTFWLLSVSMIGSGALRLSPALTVNIISLSCKGDTFLYHLGIIGIGGSVRRGYNWLMDVVETYLEDRILRLVGFKVVIRKMPRDLIRVFPVYKNLARDEQRVFSSRDPFYLSPEEWRRFKRRVRELGFKVINVDVGKLVIYIEMRRE
mgnify:CR=1 FL=1